MSPLDSFRVRQLRTKAGLSQGALAKASGVRQATISRIETGRASRVTVEMLEAIASALGVEVADLLRTVRKRGK